MAKTTTPLTAQEHVILFCIATGVSHAAVGNRRGARLRGDARGCDGGVREELAAGISQ